MLHRHLDWNRPAHEKGGTQMEEASKRKRRHSNRIEARIVVNFGRLQSLECVIVSASHFYLCFFFLLLWMICEYRPKCELRCLEAVLYLNLEFGSIFLLFILTKPVFTTSKNESKIKKIEAEKVLKESQKKRKKKWLFVALENQFTKRLTRKRSGMSCPVCLCV